MLAYRVRDAAAQDARRVVGRGVAAAAAVALHVVVVAPEQRACAGQFWFIISRMRFDLVNNISELLG